MADMENFLVNNRPMAPKDWAVDVAVMLAAFLFGCGQLMLTASSIVIPDLELRQYLGIVNVVPDTSAAFVALALTTLPLAARRRFPWPVFLFVLITFLGLQSAFRGFSLTVVGPVVALYTIACERGRTEAAVAVALAVAGVLFADAPSRTASLAFFTRFQNVALLAAAALAGYAYRTHRAYVAETERRALEAERSREEEAARRVEEERVRIAREVHDITAHSLSAVSIQAAAAERLVDRDPAAAKLAIAAARTTAKDALEEIRGMIGVLRAGDPAAETEPTAGTERLDDLAAYLRRAGVDVALERFCRCARDAYKTDVQVEDIPDAQALHQQQRQTRQALDGLAERAWMVEASRKRVGCLPLAPAEVEKRIQTVLQAPAMPESWERRRAR